MPEIQVCFCVVNDDVGSVVCVKQRCELEIEQIVVQMDRNRFLASKTLKEDAIIGWRQQGFHAGRHFLPFIARNAGLPG